MLAIAIVANTVLDGSNASETQNEVQKQHASNRDKYGVDRSGDAIADVHSTTETAPAESPARMTSSIISP
jgi:hypothetical protein